MRDLVRARAAAVEALWVHRQQASAFMLEQGRTYPRKKGWTMRYLRWLRNSSSIIPRIRSRSRKWSKRFASPGSGSNVLERTIEEFVSAWSLEPLVRALQTLRGIDLIVALTFATEFGDVSRFETSRQLMGYLGLVPDE